MPKNSSSRASPKRGAPGNIATNDVSRLQRFASDVERAFGRVPEKVRQTYSVSLNFSAPGEVPGFASQNMTIESVEMGDTVLVGASITAPAGFHATYLFCLRAGRLRSAIFEGIDEPEKVKDCTDTDGGVLRFPASGQTVL